MSVQRPGSAAGSGISYPQMYIHTHTWHCALLNVCKVDPCLAWPRIKDHGRRQTIWINMRTNANWMSAKWRLRVWKTAHSQAVTETETETGTTTGDCGLELKPWSVDARAAQFASCPAAFWAILFNSTFQFIYICGRIILQLFKNYYQFVGSDRGQLLWLCVLKPFRWHIFCFILLQSRGAHKGTELCYGSRVKCLCVLFIFILQANTLYLRELEYR